MGNMYFLIVCSILVIGFFFLECLLKRDDGLCLLIVTSVMVLMNLFMWIDDTTIIKKYVFDNFKMYVESEDVLNNSSYEPIVKNIVDKHKEISLNKVSVDNVNKNLDIVNININKKKPFFIENEVKVSVYVNKNVKKGAMEVKLVE